MITVGEAAQIYGSQLDDVGSDIGGLAVKVAKTSFMAGVSWAERFISVEESLPPASDEDLILRGIDDRGCKGIVDIGYMHEPGNSPNNFISLGGVLVKVTHWRPIRHRWVNTSGNKTMF